MINTTNQRIFATVQSGYQMLDAQGVNSQAALARKTDKHLILLQKQCVSMMVLSAQEF